MADFIYKPSANAAGDFSGAEEFTGVNLNDVVNPADGTFDVFMRVQQGLVINDTAPVSFDPATLYAGGKQGFWFEFDDLSTLWQDSGRTTAVASNNDPVSAIDDKSGNGHNMEAINATGTYINSAGERFLRLPAGQAGFRQTTGTLIPANTADMAIFVGLRTTDTTGILLPTGNGSSWVGAMNQGSGAATQSLFGGTPTFFANATQIGSPTMGTLAANWSTGAKLTANVRTFNWVSPSEYPALGYYVNGAGFSLEADIFCVICCEAPTAQDITDILAYIAGKL